MFGSGRMLMISERKSAPIDGAHVRAFPAQEAGAAEHGGGDARQREARAHACVADPDLGDQEEPGERGHQASKR